MISAFVGGIAAGERLARRARHAEILRRDAVALHRVRPHVGDFGFLAQRNLVEAVHAMHDERAQPAQFRERVAHFFDQRRRRHADHLHAAPRRDWSAARAD